MFHVNNLWKVSTEIVNLESSWTHSSKNDNFQTLIFLLHLINLLSHDIIAYQDCNTVYLLSHDYNLFDSSRLIK